MQAGYSGSLQVVTGVVFVMFVMDTVGEVSKDGERSDAGCVGARFIAPWVGRAPLRQQDL